MQSELLQRIERAAAANKPAPKDLRPPEEMLYYMLVGVYAAYQVGRFTKEQGHDKKTEVYTEYNRMAAEYKQFTEICAENQKRIRDSYSIKSDNERLKRENALLRGQLEARSRI